MQEVQKRGRGRPSALDRPVALKEAMKLFWEHGYEGTSFDDLISRMGISPSTFYNSFGSKEALYKESADCFVQTSSKWFTEALSDESLDTFTAFSHLLEKLAYEFTREDMPHGCMVSLSGTHQGAELESIRSLMADYRARSEQWFVDRIRKGIKEGDMPADCDAKGLAAFVNALIRGIAVQARDGASRKRLNTIVKIAMQAWPRQEGSSKQANPRKRQQIA